jgi:hypothetical protein
MTDDEEMHKNAEVMSLLPDRYYIILRSTGDNEFTLSAYDTTDNTYEEDEDFTSAMVVQEGVLDLIRFHTDDVYDRGVASIQFKLVGQQMMEEAEIDDPKLTKQVEGNVIKVDFGKMQ